DAGPAPPQHDVLPFLLRHCTACHGLRRQEGGLALRPRAAMLRGGKSGPALVSGKPEASAIIQKIRSGHMPPRDRLVEASVKPVEPAETEGLIRWIAAGAPPSARGPRFRTSTPHPAGAPNDPDIWRGHPPRTGR